MAWLTSRFHDKYIVVVEGGNAVVWKGRALRGVVGVDTLDPPLATARSCQRGRRNPPAWLHHRAGVHRVPPSGIPIVVPERSAAAAHVRQGGGFTYSTMSGLLEAVELLSDEGVGARVGARGRQYAEEHYADVGRFVERVALCAGAARRASVAEEPVSAASKTAKLTIPPNLVHGLNVVVNVPPSVFTARRRFMMHDE